MFLPLQRMNRLSRTSQLINPKTRGELRVCLMLAAGRKDIPSGRRGCIWGPGKAAPEERAGLACLSAPGLRGTTPAWGGAGEGNWEQGIAGRGNTFFLSASD